MRGNRWKQTDVAMDIGSHCVKAMQIDRAGHVLRSAVFPRSSEALDDKEWFRCFEILDRHGFPLDSIVLLPPRGSVVSRLIELPAKPSRERDGKILASQLGLSHAVDVEHEVAWWLVPTSSSQQARREALASAIRGGKQHDWSGVFRQAQVGLRRIDLPAFAGSRAAGIQDGLVIDLGVSGLGITLCQEGRPIYVRQNSSLGLPHAHHGGGSNQPFAGSWAAGVVDACFATLQYADRRFVNREHRQIAVLGGGASERLAAELERRLGLPVQRIGTDIDPLFACSWAALAGRAA